MKSEKWAWLLPWVGTSVGRSLADDAVRMFGEGRGGALYALIGVVLGWGWFRLYPRPLAERLLPLCVLGLVMAVILFLNPGGHMEPLSVAYALPAGVVAGLVLTEQWRAGAEWPDQSRRESSSPRPMPGPG